MNEAVSIIIPVYNAGAYLRETIASVRAQSVRCWELILVDDGSSDNSRDIIEEETARGGDIRLLENSGPHGASYARNLGIAAAKGRYLCYLDADDLWHPEKLERQLSFMKEHRAAFSFTGYEFADEN
ncbi:MAG TPA: glycosyltransferase family 2 protein, partial [Lachnospiraceae bacterium]|nr:glycosyltransferase family 2 protein [Lachnospiraceae bacterium]